MPRAGPQCTVRFGIFEFSPEVGELRKNGSPLKLFGQPIQVLELLLESPGRLVTRDELQQKIWSGSPRKSIDLSGRLNQHPGELSTYM
jgi:DNA-binding winged helix-turn-helix (wHTH) protein